MALFPTYSRANSALLLVEWPEVKALPVEWLNVRYSLFLLIACTDSCDRFISSPLFLKRFPSLDDPLVYLIVFSPA